MKNAILITIDTLRADHMSCLGYYRKTTPNLDNLAKNGVLFTNAASVGCETITSIQSLLSSDYALEYFVRSEAFKRFDNIPKFDRNTVLEIYKHGTRIAKILKNYGYITAAFHSSPLLSRYYNFGTEFDHLDDFITSSVVRKYKIRRKLQKYKRLFNLARYIYYKIFGVKESFVGKRAETINKKVISWLKEWLKENKSNFFIWIHYMDVHGPYIPPKEFQLYFRSKPLNSSEIQKLLFKRGKNKPEEMSKSDLGDLFDLYDAEIRYIDHEIKSFLDELSEMGILDDTFVIITADHGEEFGEHGNFGHGDFGEQYGKLYDELIHVPLIIYNSPYKNVKVDEPVGLVDVAPTILDLLGIPVPKSFQGRSLVPLIRGEGKSSGAISECLQKGRMVISYRTKEWKYIFNEADNQRELYNIENDPKEMKNLYESEMERAKEFELKIREHIAKQKKRITGLSDERERIKERIEALKRIDKI